MTLDNFGVEIFLDGEWVQYGDFVPTKAAAQRLLLSQNRVARIFEMVPIRNKR